MSQDNGGPAFPARWRSQPTDEPNLMGMTLRDYFAARAMQAIITGLTSTQTSTDAEDASKIAQAAYLAADAMLKERNK